MELSGFAGAFAGAEGVSGVSEKAGRRDHPV